jgi:hypothetical protein
MMKPIDEKNGVSWKAKGDGAPWSHRQQGTRPGLRAYHHDSQHFTRAGAAMCRNIRTLFNFEPPATEVEIRDASLQFVRKLSGFTVPSKANEAAFERAVDEVAASARVLIRSLVTSAEPRTREVEAAKAKARAAIRFGAPQ